MVRLTPFLPETHNDTENEIEVLVTQGDAAQWERRERLQNFFTEHTLELVCGCDQVGTLKILSTKNGEIIKEIQCDSFGVRLNDNCGVRLNDNCGVPLGDSFPDLFT